MRRYEIEKAVDRAQLPGPSTGIMRALLARINARTGTIPSQHQPSLSQIAALTGYDRSTVMRHLNWLEQAGWVIRIRPPLWLAQTQHTTTAYAMRIPGGHPQARRRGEPRQAAERELARRAAAEALAARDSEADRAAADDHASPEPGPRRAPEHKTDTTTDDQTGSGQRSSSGPDDDPQLHARLAKTAIEELHELTGRTVTLRQAAEVTRIVLAGRRVKHHEAYLRRALRADPQRYLPAGPNTPPAIRDLGPAFTRRAEAIRRGEVPVQVINRGKK